MPEIRARDCKTGREVIENFKAVRARLNALPPPRAPIVTIPIREETLVAVAVEIVRPQPVAIAVVPKIAAELAELEASIVG